MYHEDSRKPETPSDLSFLALIIGFIILGLFVYYLHDALQWLEDQAVAMYRAAYQIVVSWF
ncbi:hypothetical protein JNK62_00815 [bacterium]|nr:hypothetical protein [bacterium]